MSAYRLSLCFASIVFPLYACGENALIAHEAELLTASPVSWTASWIWYPARQGAVNYHFFARRAFDLSDIPQQAKLHVSAQTEYQLYINGQFVGRGPTPCDPAWQSYDTHDVQRLLRKGKNVIAVVCYNEGVGVHWQYAGPGGLIAQLELDTESGRQTINSDGSWKVREADCYDLRSPRFFWSCGFAETFHADRFDARWTDTDYDDGGWQAGQVLGLHGTRPWQHLIPREIPFLALTRETPVSLEKGRFTLRGVHAVRFGQILQEHSAGLVYAQTYFQCDADRELTLRLECDDAFRCFVNGQQVMKQEYNPDEVRTKLWRGYDEFEQVHHGTTLGWSSSRRVKLHQGWNKVLVAMDHGPAGWGFCLALVDPAGDTVINLPFAADQKEDRTWQIAGPLPSTGLSDSLERPIGDVSEVTTASAATCQPFVYADDVTDYSILMHYEQRMRPGPVSSVGLTIGAGEYAILDMGKVTVGFPRFTLDAKAGTVLDVGYSQVFFEDRRIRFSNGGAMKNVDRLCLREGTQQWQPFQRRTGRFIHLSCRAGSANLSSADFLRVGYPVQDVATFECSDPTLNRIWEVSRYTSRLLMHCGFQDCLKREQGTFNTNQSMYQYLAAAYCFGDQVLVRKCLNAAIRTQQDDGWFHAHGPSSPNQDETTLCFYWLLLLREYYQQTGDLAYVREVFPRAEDMLRCFAKWTNRYGLLDGNDYVVSRPGQLIYLDDSQLEGPYVGHFFGELVGFNIVYHDALRAAGDLSDALSSPEPAAFYRAKADRVRRACTERLWDDKRGRYADFRKDDKLSGTHHPVFQIAAIYHGLCDDDRRARLMSYLVKELGLPSADRPDYPLYTFGYYYYYLEVLFQNDRENEALELMRSYYGRWLEEGGTTFGEHFRVAQMASPALDFEYEVHGYGTSAHPHFYQNILGVRPATPGFKKVLIAPHPGDLKWARGRVSTIQGPVQVSWKQATDVFELQVQLPPACEYEVRLPPRYRSVALKVNGDPVPWKLRP